MPAESIQEYLVKQGYVINQTEEYFEKWVSMWQLIRIPFSEISGTVEQFIRKAKQRGWVTETTSLTREGMNIVDFEGKELLDEEPLHPHQNALWTVGENEESTVELWTGKTLPDEELREDVGDSFVEQIASSLRSDAILRQLMQEYQALIDAAMQAALSDNLLIAAIAQEGIMLV